MLVINNRWAVVKHSLSGSKHRIKWSEGSKRDTLKMGWIRNNQKSLMLASKQTFVWYNSGVWLPLFHTVPQATSSHYWFISSRERNSSSDKSKTRWFHATVSESNWWIPTWIYNSRFLRIEISIWNHQDKEFWNF